ncbi:hypothetical protein KC352_g29 [Hortaea werneckii]|nr:hypothetical protein KC352_g29 [Hortaea werneckii]
MRQIWWWRWQRNNGCRSTMRCATALAFCCGDCLLVLILVFVFTAVGALSLLSGWSDEEVVDDAEDDDDGGGHWGCCYCRRAHVRWKDKFTVAPCLVPKGGIELTACSKLRVRSHMQSERVKAAKETTHKGDRPRLLPHCRFRKERSYFTRTRTSRPCVHVPTVNLGLARGAF